jgi:hypothetical protein
MFLPYKDCWTQFDGEWLRFILISLKALLSSGAAAPLASLDHDKVVWKQMFEDFRVADHWTGEELHCVWKANIVAIATRHADAVDVRFDVNGRPVWIAMPLQAWVEFRKKTGNVITDYLAAQIAGRYLKHAIQSGYDNGREIYTMKVEEVLDHLDQVMKEAGSTQNLPTLPVMQP